MSEPSCAIRLFALGLVRFNRFLTVLFIAMLLLAAAGRAFCQVDPTLEQGIALNRAYQGGDIDQVNTMNGSLLLHIPLASFPQLGRLKLGFSLNYSGAGAYYNYRKCNSKGVCSTYFGRNASIGWGWGPQPLEDSSVLVSFSDALSQGVAVNHLIETISSSKFLTTNIVSITDAMGTTHPLGYDNSNWAHLRSTDGSGYLYIPSNPQLYEANTATNPLANLGVVYDTNGAMRTFGLNGSVNGSNTYGLVSAVDPIGNKISYSGGNGTYTDTVGRSVPDAMLYNMSASTTGCPSVNAQYQPLVGSWSWVVPGYNGGTETFLFCFASVNVSTEVGGTAEIVTHTSLQSVVLPNKTFWAFTYDSANPSGTGPLAYGDLLQVIRPEGGSITYTYSSTGSFCFNTSSVARTVQTRTINPLVGQSSTWQYSYGHPTGSTNAYSNTITDPTGAYVVYSYQSISTSGCTNVEQNHKVYSSSSALLRTVTTSYQSVADPQAELNSGYWLQAAAILPNSNTTTLDSGQSTTTSMSYDGGFVDAQPVCTNTAGGITCQSGYTISPQNVTLGRKIDENISDYSGTLLRDVKTSYQWQSNSSYSTANILDAPCLITTYGPGSLPSQTSCTPPPVQSNQAAQTIYGYDENNGSPQGVFGNNTSVTRWLNTGASTKTQTIYNSQSMPKTTIDANLNNTQITYDSTGLFPKQIQYPSTNGVSHIEQPAYDANTGLLTSYTDQNGNKTSYSYDSAYRITSVNYPDGGSTTYCYTDIGGITCSASSPPYQRVTTRSASPDPNVQTTAVYDGLGRVFQTQLNSDPSGTTYTATTYDLLGRVSQVYNPTRCNPPTTKCSESTWGFTTYLYDALGRTCLVVPQDGTPPSGTTCQTSQPADSVFTTYSGNCTTVTDEVGNARQSCNDALGRLTSVAEDPGSAPHFNYLTSYSYDALDNLTSVVQNGSRQRSFTYDSVSRLVCASNPENSSAACPTTAASTYTTGTTGYTYDANGNLLSKTALAPNQTGSATVTTSYTYDALNRLTGKSYSDGTTPTALFGYDTSTVTIGTVGGSEIHATATNNIGRLSWMATEPYATVGTQTSFSYDPIGRINQLWSCTNVSCSNSILYLTYTYDQSGNETGRGEQGPPNYTSTYNGAGRILSFTNSSSNTRNPGNLLSAATYDASGHTNFDTLANGLSETWKYDRRGRLVAQAAGTGCTAGTGTCSTSTYNLSLSYFANSNVQTANDSVNGTATYGYDSLSRVNSMSASGNQCTGLTWSYDAWGNRTDQTNTGGNCTSFHIAAATAKNQLPAPPYSYDAAGNLLGDGTYNYTYDAENRLKSASSTGTAATYFYDAQGHRAEKDINGSPTLDYFYDRNGQPFIWFGPSFYQELHVAGRHLATYRNVPGQNATDEYFHHSDWLGTERARTDYQGNRCETVTNQPYGDNQIVTSTCAEGDISLLHFTGKERDGESGLDNFGARSFGSSIGRFMSADPENGSGYDNPGDPQGWNAYSYVRNNPLTLTDPDGRDYYVCINNGNGGQNCTTYHNDADFVRAATASGVALSGDPEGSGNIYATVNGEQVQVGTFQHFGSTSNEGTQDVTGDYFFNFPAASSLVRGIFNLGRAAGALELTTIGSGSRLAGAAAVREGLRASGGVIRRVIQTSAGPVDVYAKVVAEGETAVIKELAVYPATGGDEILDVGYTQMRQGFKGVLSDLKEAGYSDWRMEPQYRSGGPGASGGANPFGYTGTLQGKL